MSTACLFSDYAISISNGSYSWGGSNENGTLTGYVHVVILGRIYIWCMHAYLCSYNLYVENRDIVWFPLTIHTLMHDEQRSKTLMDLRRTLFQPYTGHNSYHMAL